MPCKRFILLLFICHTFGFMDIDLVLSFIRAKSLKHNVVLTCNSRESMVQLQKELSVHQNMLFAVKNFQNLNILDNLVANYRRMGVMLNGDCDHVEQFLIRCRKYKVFDTKHFWLVLFGSSNYQDLFQNAPLNIDSDVKVAYKNTARPGEYFIDDVYNPAFGKGGQLTLSNVGSYGRDGYQVKGTANKYVARRNLTGVQFDIIVVLNEPYEEPLLDYLKYNDKNVEIDTLGRFHARLLCYCEEYYNYSVRIAGVTNSWGYYQPDGTMDGLVGALQRHQVDFGLTPLVTKIERTKFISFGKGTWHLRMAFVLRNPNSKRSYEIFIKPFSWEVWLCVIVTSILGLLAQKCSYKLDQVVREMVRKNRTREDTSWSFSVLCMFGTFCQQGITAVPHCLSGRTSGFILLWLGALIYQFYSAALVSFLLNVPVTVLSSVQDILDSDFEIGYENVKYAKSILQQATNSLAKEVCRRVSLGNESGLLKRDEGLNLVKKGHYAFHVELVTGYPFIDKNFEPSMICELREIPLFPTMFMYAGYQKWSPFKDVIDVWFEEYGITRRELQFWHPKKPECVRTPSLIVINTSLEDFYPALVILLLGITLSLQILFVEVLWRNREMRKRKLLHFTE